MHSNGEMMNDEFLIKIDEPRIQEACNAYFKWKDLNTYVKSLVSRGINMPDAISEPMGCYCLDLLWNKRNLEPTVIFDVRRGKIVEKSIKKGRVQILY